jgi:hypothetical protein
MSLPLSIVQKILEYPPEKAWETIFKFAWKICSSAIADGKQDSIVPNRDRIIGEIDLFLATAGWDLWNSFESAVPKTSTKLIKWWDSQSGGKAVLILDALSLRESPWIINEAKDRGFNVNACEPSGAELPADTTPFAKALGFSQRSVLNNNGAGSAHKLLGAITESTDIAWKDCSNMIGAEPNWVFWHHWPDHRLHQHDDPGKGLSTLTQEVRNHLTCDDFWSLVGRLTKGRHLIITSDHGYAASGRFPDSDKEQSNYLKNKYKSGRWIDGNEKVGNWIPPIDLSLNTKHGSFQFVLGRRKWKSPGGYPTLTHGGLSVLEVIVPWIELSK